MPSSRPTARPRIRRPRADERPTYRIDGAAFADLEGFYDEVERELLRDQPWGRSLDALDDVLRGETGGLPREFRLVWEHADLTRRQFRDEAGLDFPALLDRIARHRNVELVIS